MAGLSPSKLSLTISLGFCIGLFPLVGTTSLLCALVGFGFRLNQIILQVSNWLLAPLQLLFIVPFYKLGSTILGSDATNNASSLSLSIFSANFYDNFSIIIGLQLTAIVGWLVVALPFWATSFFITYKIAKLKSS